MQPYINYQSIPNVQIGLLSELQPIDLEDKEDPNQPIMFSVLYHLENLLKKMGIQFSRTQKCKHRGSCLCSALVSSGKAGAASYLIKSGISILFSLKKLFKKPSLVISALKSKESLSFGFFIFAYLIIFRAFVCTIRRLLPQNKQKYGFLIGGLVGGTSSAFVLDKKTRQAFGLFLIARAIDIIYKSLVQKGKIPDFKYYYAFLYSIMMVVTGGYAYGQEPASMSPDLHKFYLSFTAENANDQLMRQIWIQRKNNQLFKDRDVSLYNPLDYLPKARKVKK